MDSSGLTFMVIPVAVPSRSAKPLPGCPAATMPASSDVTATALTPMSARTCASRREENLSPCDVSRSLACGSRRSPSRASLKEASLSSKSLRNSSSLSPSNSWPAVSRCFSANCFRMPSLSGEGLSAVL